MRNFMDKITLAYLVTNLNAQAHEADLWPSPTFSPSTTSQEAEETLTEFHAERDDHYDWLRSVARWLRQQNDEENGWEKVADAVEQLVDGEPLHACLIDVVYGDELCTHCGAGHSLRSSQGLYSDTCRLCGHCVWCGREDGLEHSGNRCRWTDCPGSDQ